MSDIVPEGAALLIWAYVVALLILGWFLIEIAVPWLWNLIFG